MGEVQPRCLWVAVGPTQTQERTRKGRSYAGVWIFELGGYSRCRTPSRTGGWNTGLKCGYQKVNWAGEERVLLWVEETLLVSGNVFFSATVGRNRRLTFYCGVIRSCKSSGKLSLQFGGPFGAVMEGGSLLYTPGVTRGLGRSPTLCGCDKAQPCRLRVFDRDFIRLDRSPSMSHSPQTHKVFSKPFYLGHATGVGGRKFRTWSPKNKPSV